MKQIAAIIFQNPEWKFLVYLRDNIDTIPFPHHRDLIWGHVDPWETPEQALIREIEEEIWLTPDQYEYKFHKKYICTQWDIYPNEKYIYHGKINKTLEELTLYEWEKLAYITSKEFDTLPFANIIWSIMKEYRDTLFSQ